MAASILRFNFFVLFVFAFNLFILIPHGDLFFYLSINMHLIVVINVS